MKPHVDILRRQRRPGSRRGFVLLAVLVFVMLLSMVTVSLLFRSRAEETAASASAGAEQAWAAALSGVEEALHAASAAVPGNETWTDDPAAFRGRLVTEDGADRWYFTIFSPGDSSSPVEIRHGLTDEARRIDLNHIGTADLAKTPRRTPAMAQALRQAVGTGPDDADPVDPVDPVATIPDDAVGRADPVDEDVIPATVPILGVLPVRTAGPLTSLDDLLGVPGFSWSLLHGEDANLNGRLDPNENDGDEQFPPDNKDNRLDHGMGQYLTVGSYERSRTRAGRPKIDLNDPSAPLPEAGLPAAFTNYVAALRAAKVKLRHPAEVLEASVRSKDEQGKETDVASGITKEELPLVLDLFTTDAKERLEGLVNIGTADALVLATLPGIDPALAETIVSTRGGLGADRRATIAWLFQEGIVDATRFKVIAPHITTGSHQFSFHVIGYGVPSGRYRVLDATIDVAGDVPRVTRLRDITRLGLPFKLVGDILEEARSGASL